MAGRCRARRCFVKLQDRGSFVDSPIAHAISASELPIRHGCKGLCFVNSGGQSLRICQRVKFFELLQQLKLGYIIL